MKRLLKWVMTSMVLLVLTAVFVIYNPAVIKGPLENYLASVSGYDIRLAGDLDIELGRLTRLQVTDIHIAAPAWATREELVVVGKLDLSLETTSLFADVVILDALSIDGLDVNLEKDTSGAGNWLPGLPDGPENKAGPTEPLIVFNNIQLSTASLRYKNNKTNIEHHLQIDSVDQKQQADGMLRLVLGGNLNKKPVALELTVGPYSNLLQGQDIGYSGKGHFGSMMFSGNGSIDDLLAPRRPVFNIELHGSDLDEITVALGLDDLGNGEYYFNLAGAEAEGKYKARAEGRIGNFSLDVSVNASDLSQLSSLDMQISAQGPNLGSVTRPFGLDHWPDKPFDIRGNLIRQDDTLNIQGLKLGISGTTLTLDAMLSNFPRFDPSQAKLHIQGDDVSQFRELLGVHGVATGPFELHGSLAVVERDIELLNIDLQTSLGHLNVSGTLGNGPRFAGSNLRLILEGKSAHELMSVFDIDALPKDAFTLDTRFATKEDGLLIEKGVLVTSKHDRLAIDGYLSYESGMMGTNINANLQGPSLAHVMQQLVPGLDTPDLPYELNGMVSVVEKGLQLKAVKSQIAGVELGLAGLVMFADQGLGTELDIDLQGDDISGLYAFRDLGSALDVFLPGQPYVLGGKLSFASQGWKLDGVEGRVGESVLALDGLISGQTALDGSRLNFSIHGPGLHKLLQLQDIDNLPKGAFKAGGQMLVGDGRLVLQDFTFNSDTANAFVGLDTAWPVAKPLDATFNLQFTGDDIRTVVPSTLAFKPGLAAFSLSAEGSTQEKVLSLKQFDAQIGELQVSIQGQQDDPSLTDTFTLALQASTDNLSRLGELKGRQLPNAPLNLKAVFKGNTDRFLLEGLELLLGESDINARLDVALTGSRPSFNLKAQSGYINLQPYLQSEDKVPGADPEPSGFLIPETRLPLDILSMADLTVDIKIDEFKLKNEITRNVVLQASIQDGGLEVSELSLDGKKGHMISSLSIEPTGNNFADVKVDLNANDMVLNLFGLAEEGLYEMPAFDIKLQANGSGRNLRELAGSLNGSVSTAGSAGVLPDVSLGVLDTFILDEVFSLIMPNSADEDTLNLSCHAAELTITDGFVSTTPAMTYTTDKISIVAKGTLNLKTEAIHMNFNATPTNAFKISAGELFNPYILIGGTLSKPSVGLDPAKTLLHGGAAVGTAGISVLAKGLYDRVNQSKSLCEEMRDSARLQVQQKQ